MTMIATRLILAPALIATLFTLAACSTTDTVPALKQPTPTSQNPAHQQHFPRS